MKTPKEKAKELIEKFTLLTTGGYDLAKESALICVEEILKEIVQHTPNGTFWQEVKSEIEKL